MAHLRLLVVSLALATARAQSSTPSVVYGIDFSPYENGQDPNLNAQVSVSQILSRMQIVAPYTKWVRSFSSTNGLENIPSVARQLGLKVAANAWISSDAAQNTAEINNLIAAANSGLVDIAIVGSEAILRNDVSVSQLIAYMNQVRQAIPQNIPVTTADVYGTFLAQPSLIAASDIVFANFYPYWEGTSINNALCSLEQEYRQLVAASGSKQVVISETGWPSAGNAVGAAVPSPANENLFALQFFSWAGANNIPAFYFEAFDEAWKAAYEGPQGAHWGIFDVNGAIKPGMDAFFSGQTTLVACNGILPPPLGISFTYVPPYGSSDELEAQVGGVQPASYTVATYIKVSGGWWTKPTFAQPTVAINPDGTVRIPIVTGGSDQLATDIAAFLIPSSVAPPQVGGGTLPTIPSAIATVQASRTPSSISGTIADNLGNPISGATISDPVLGSTTSAPDGKYSFYQITTSGTATLTVSYPNYTFPTSPATVSISSGNQVVNFTGTQTVDLSVLSSVSPNPGSTGSNVVETIVGSNAGPASASDAIVTVPIPTSFTLVSASTTRGSCNTATLPVTCDIGSLAPTAYATVAVVAMPTSAGSFNLSASISGPDPDSDPADNSTSLVLTIQALQSITFGPLSNVTFGVAPFNISATASSALPVSFASTTPAVCALSGSTTTILAAGACSITASQPGNATYAAATQVNQSFQVAQLSQGITFSALSNEALGTAPFTVSATASSGLAVSFNSQTTPICTVSGSTVTLISVGACTIQATQAGNTDYAVATAVNQSFQVNHALQFYPLTPCRVADTRTFAGFTGAQGPPYMAGKTTRNFPVAGLCGAPANATAYSLNMTVVPRTAYLGYLTTWPAGQPQPVASTLNSWEGQVVANAALVPAGTNGAIGIYVSDDTDVLFDINGYFAPPAASGLQFYPLTPCRVADTRTFAGFTGAQGPPYMAGKTSRSFPVAGLCGAPASAAAYSLNMTVVPQTDYFGYLATWPTGLPQPVASTLNSWTGTVVANAAVVPAGNGAISIYVSDDTDVLFDINGYFAPPGAAGLNYYTMTPCRVADTREFAGMTGQFGPPSMAGKTSRSFPVQSSACSVPATAAAYALNVTVVPETDYLGYLATWPTGLPQPVASTLNSWDGQVRANAALVPAGTSGAISIYVSDPTDVLFDISGYFGP